MTYEIPPFEPLRSLADVIGDECFHRVVALVCDMCGRDVPLGRPYPDELSCDCGWTIDVVKVLTDSLENYHPYPVAVMDYAPGRQNDWDSVQSIYEAMQVRQ